MLCTGPSPSLNGLRVPGLGIKYGKLRCSTIDQARYMCHMSFLPIPSLTDFQSCMDLFTIGSQPERTPANGSHNAMPTTMTRVRYVLSYIGICLRIEGR